MFISKRSPILFLIFSLSLLISPITSAKLSNDEQRFIQLMAEDVKLRFAEVVENPSKKYPKGSIEEQLRNTYRNMKPEYKQNAKKYFKQYQKENKSRSSESRIKISKNRKIKLPAQLSSLSKSIIDERIRNAKMDVKKYENMYQHHVNEYKLPSSSVLLSYATGEVTSDKYRRIRLGEPNVIEVYWKSYESDAKQVYWELRRKANSLRKEEVLGGGYAVDNKNEPGLGGYFELDLKRYIKSAAPNLSEGEFHVRIIPVTKRAVELQKNKQRLTLSNRDSKNSLGTKPKQQRTSTLATKNDGTYVPATNVGTWSAPGIIDIGKLENPQLNFSELYEKVKISADRLYLKQDQQELGTEEFYTLGFLQSYAPEGSWNKNNKADQRKIGPFYNELDTSDRVGTIDFEATYKLPISSAAYPRKYIALIGMIEEDDGGFMSDWFETTMAFSDQLLAEVLVNNIHKELRELREKLMQESVDKQNEVAWEAMEAANSSDFLSAWVKTMYTIIAEAIKGGMRDDNYGVNVVTYMLTSNERAAAENHQILIASYNTSQAFKTVFLPPKSITSEKIIFEEFTIPFYGFAFYPQAGSFDGIVELDMQLGLLR